MDNEQNEKIIQQRTEKIKQFFKNNYNWLVYVALAVIVFITYRIRTLNLSGLRDITTGGWTLGPDLDPFLFLRWAKYLAENGTIYAIDTMRYVPLGFNTRGELFLHSYLIVWFHKIAEFLGISSSITQSAALYPAFVFVITIIAFFLLVRQIFIKTTGKRSANLIAVISSLFLALDPSILPRTIAGIPEKESSGFLFLFLAFYFFILAWNSENKKPRIIYSILSGISTALMALVWGGYIFIFVTIAAALFISFLLEQVTIKKFAIYAIWLFSFIIATRPFSARYSMANLIGSTTTSIAFAVFFIILIHLLIFNTKLKNRLPRQFEKLPKPLTSLIIGAVITIIVASIIFGPTFIFDKLDTTYHNLISPVTDRLSVTVAENRQPYFAEWSETFGPTIKGAPLFFWIFVIGSIFLFYEMVSIMKKREQLILTLSYTLFLFAMIFSRYKEGSLLNGTNHFSVFVYALGVIIFIGALAFYWYKYHGSGDSTIFKQLSFSIILFFSFFFLTIIAARGAVRLIMMLAPSASIIASYILITGFIKAKEVKDDLTKLLAWTLFIILVISAIFSANYFYKVSYSTAQSYVPSAYNQQWQKAMQWVREDTPKDAVFGHWWDYGYWIQSIGDRATVLDGGNSIPYWNYLMGRHALTAPDNYPGLEFLYAHNTTHFLIDSTDIGKYGAFSSIGSDYSYDRQSWIPTFLRDSKQTQETKTSIRYIYQGGTAIDQDIIYEQNNSKIFLPAYKAGIGGVITEETQNQTLASQPIGVFIYQGKQYNLPLRYAYDGKFRDFGKGVEAGIYLMPNVNLVSNTQVSVEKNGALLYLSNKTVKSQLARLYLYKEENPYFKLVHSEDDFLVAQLKANSLLKNEDIANYQGLRGPIRIWEINYPKNIAFNKEYLETNYPDITLLTG